MNTNKKLILSLLLTTPIVAFAAPSNMMVAQTDTSTNTTTTNNSSIGATMKKDAQKTGEYVDDSALTTKIKSALLAKKNLSSTHISVESTDGVVTLTGNVPTASQHKLAVATVKKLKGVKDVHDSIEVLPESASN